MNPSLERGISCINLSIPRLMLLVFSFSFNRVFPSRDNKSAFDEGME